MRTLAALLIAFSVTPVIAQAGGSKSKVTIGRIEYVNLPTFQVRMKARIDTGARISSIHAVNPHVIEVNGKKFVEFETYDRAGKKYICRSPLIRTSRIKSTQGTAERRYVIRETVRVGKVSRKILISLNDRTNMKYKFLAGRNLLIGRFVVDVSLSHTVED